MISIYLIFRQQLSSILLRYRIVFKKLYFYDFIIFELSFYLLYILIKIYNKWMKNIKYQYQLLIF